MKQEITDTILNALKEEFEVEFTIYGKSQPEQRARRGRGGFFYIPKETREFQHVVQKEFIETINQARPAWLELPHTGSCELEVIVYKPLPKSTPKWKLNLLKKLETLKEKLKINPIITTGDCDNYAKIVADALQGIAYKNDKQCNTMIVKKDLTFEFPKTKIILRFFHDIDLIYKKLK